MKTKDALTLVETVREHPESYVGFEILKAVPMKSAAEDQDDMFLQNGG
jgi:hypothetical protein